MSRSSTSVVHELPKLGRRVRLPSLAPSGPLELQGVLFCPGIFCIRIDGFTITGPESPQNSKPFAPTDGKRP